MSRLRLGTYLLQNLRRPQKPSHSPPEKGISMNAKLSRRQMITGCGAGLAAGAATAMASAAAASETPADPGNRPFRYALNTGTIMGFKLPLDKEIELAAKAGYDGIEPWTRNINRYVEDGNSLEDLAKRTADLGLIVESAIGFPRWAAEDEKQRTEGMEPIRREMDMVARLGGKRIAAPPAGINRTAGIDLRKVAQRYRAVLELGRKMGVVGVPYGVLQEADPLLRALDVTDLIAFSASTIGWCRIDCQERDIQSWSYFVLMVICCPGPAITLIIYLFVSRGTGGFWATAKFLGYAAVLVAVVFATAFVSAAVSEL